MSTSTTLAAPAMVANVPASEAPAAWRQWLARHRQAVVLPVLFIGAMVIFTALAPGFLSLDNLTNVARQSVYLLIVSLAQLLVLIGGGLGLSGGAGAGLSSGGWGSVGGARVAAPTRTPRRKPP